MRHRSSSIIWTATLAALLVALPAAAPAKIKCWKNKEGVRECGNAIPPEYAQQETEVKSSRGLTTKKKSRAKTAAELEKERQEEEKLAKQREQEEREREAQAAKDRVLLATFTTEEDMVLTRDGQLQAIDSRIKHANLVVAKLRSTLKEYQGEAAAQERSGNKVSEKILANIDSVQKQIKQNLSFIDDRESEKTNVMARFERDLARYRQLKGN